MFEVFDGLESVGSFATMAGAVAVATALVATLPEFLQDDVYIQQGKSVFHPDGQFIAIV